MCQSDNLAKNLQNANNDFFSFFFSFFQISLQPLCFLWNSEMVRVYLHYIYRELFWNLCVKLRGDKLGDRQKTTKRNEAGTKMRSGVSSEPTRHFRIVWFTEPKRTVHLLSFPFIRFSPLFKHLYSIYYQRIRLLMFELRWMYST